MSEQPYFELFLGSNNANHAQDDDVLILEFDRKDLAPRKERLLKEGGYTERLFNLIDLMVYPHSPESSEKYKSALKKTISSYFSEYLALRKLDLNNGAEDEALDNNGKYKVLDEEALYQDKCAYLYFHPLRKKLEILYEKGRFPTVVQADETFGLEKDIYVDVSELIMAGLSEDSALEEIKHLRRAEYYKKYVDYDPAMLERTYRRAKAGFEPFDEKWGSIFDGLVEVAKAHKVDLEEFDFTIADGDDDEQTKAEFSWRFKKTDLQALAESDLKALPEIEKNELLENLLCDLIEARKRLKRSPDKDN